MRAVVYDAYGTTPTVREVPVPPCPPDGVLVEVRAAGVCRSDWHAFVGHDPVPLPMTPGHELAGVVAEAGPGVRSWRPGARVTVPFVVACGTCEWCEAGEQQVCPRQQQPGFTYPGAWAEVVAVPAADTNLVAVPDAIDLVSAAALGCRFATAFRALHTHAPVGPGTVVAVHGCGGVGLSAVMIGVALGARVVAVDPEPSRRDLARDLGAELSLDPAETDVAEAIRDAFSGGAHVSVDAAGSAATASASVLSLRRRGRHVQVGLLLGPDAEAGLPMDRVVAHELSLVGSHGMPVGEYPALLALVGDRALDVGRLVEQVLTLDEAPDALVAMGTGAPTGGIRVIGL